MTGAGPLPGEDRPHPAYRRAAAALMRHGTYQENPDGWAWLQSDVDDVLCAVEHSGRDELVAHAVADEMGLP